MLFRLPNAMPNGAIDEMDNFTQLDSFKTLQDLPALLKRFLSDPIGMMRVPMRLTWSAAISLQAGCAILSGVVAGAFAQSFGDFLAGLLIFPIASVAIGVLFSLYFYYLFSLFFSTFLDFRRLHSIVVVSTVPYFALHSISGFLAPIDLIGFALTSLLLVVGLVEQFNLEKRMVMKVVGALYTVFFLVWGVAQIQTSGVEPPTRIPLSAPRASSDSTIQELQPTPQEPASEPPGELAR